MFPAFLELPLELRKHIYSFLIQTGCTFVCSALNRPRGGYGTELAIITKITPRHAPGHHKLASLMCTNRQIKAECYSMLYGDNAFYFRAGSTPTDKTTFLTTQFDKIEIWTKVFKDIKTYPMWPMTSATMLFLKEVKLMVVPRDGRHCDEYRRLKHTIGKMAYKLAQCSDLSSLDVTMSRVRRVKAFWFRKMPRPADTEEVAYDLTLKVSGSGRVSTQAADRELLWRTPADWAQYLLEPFAQLYGIGKVTLNGLIEPTFASRLKSVIMSDTPVTVPLSPAADAKKMVRRKLPGHARKKLVEQTVLQYWEPTWNWEAVGGSDAMLS